MKTLFVLRSAIPFGGFGRPLRPCEVRALRRAGVRNLSTRCIVVRLWPDGNCVGLLYRPDDDSSGCGFCKASVRLDQAENG